MARALRVQCPGGRYHVTARGNERREIFLQDEDRFRFLELLSELDQRFGTRVHAYVLMDNHYHLLLETPEPNLSRAMQWCNVSYSVWFNLRHRRSGHLLQGRFGVEIVQDDAGWQEVARYVHLNPVRVACLGLDKSARAASRAGPIQAPSSELVAERLRALRQYRWSSYPGYAGYRQPLNWVWQEPLARLCGGNTEEERRSALREYTEEPLRQGVLESPWQRLVSGVVLGTVCFAEKLRNQARGNPREQKALRAATRAVSWEQIVSALEQAKGESWNEFAERHGDWGRDAALWLGRCAGRLRLGGIGQTGWESGLRGGQQSRCAVGAAHANRPATARATGQGSPPTLQMTNDKIRPQWPPQWPPTPMAPPRVARSRATLGTKSHKTIFNPELG